MISGLPDVDIDDWKSNTEYHNYNPSSPQIQWFWRAVRSFDKEERAKLLQFVTGTSKVPLNGFKELEGMNGVNRFNIHRDYGQKDRLPSSHTCFNRKCCSYSFRRDKLTNISQSSTSPSTIITISSVDSFSKLSLQEATTSDLPERLKSNAKCRDSHNCTYSWSVSISDEKPDYNHKNITVSTYISPWQ